MTERAMYVRLPKPRQAKAREIAARRGVPVSALFASIVTDYSDGPATPRQRAVPRDERTMTEVVVPTRVRNAAVARSTKEGKSISAVIDDALALLELEEEGA